MDLCTIFTNYLYIILKKRGMVIYSPINKIHSPINRKVLVNGLRLFLNNFIRFISDYWKFFLV